MKLNALDQKLPVPHTHHFALFRLRRDLQAVRHGIALDDQRMVARGLERLGQAAKDALPGVMNARNLAMHDAVVADDLAAESRTDALMAQADTQDRDLPGEALNERHAHARLVGRAGAG